MATLRFPIARCAWAGRVILATLFVVLLCCASSASSARAQTIVSLTFDDGIATQIPAASTLQSKGMRGTFYINSSKISSPDPYFMTWAQLNALASAGHEIGGHTIDHKRLTDLTAAQQRAEICDDATALRSHGYTITDFAYPFGAGSTQPAVLSALQDCGYTSARKIGEIRGDFDCANCPFAETLPPANPYGLRSTLLPTGPISLATLQGWVTDAESNGGGWLPIVFHDICNSCADSSVSSSDFTAFVNWLSLRAAQGTVVKTVRQALAEGPQHPPPTTTIACNSGVCGTTSFKSPVSISLSATDAGGGLGATRYTLDGSDPIPSSPQYTGPFTLTQTKTVKFRTWDLGGNPEVVRTQLVNVDGTAPTTSINSPADGSRVIASGSGVTVKVDAADAGSGVSDVQLFVDGDWKGSSTSTSSPYQFTFPAGSLALGAHRLKAIAVDAAGNQTTSAETTFTLSDGTPTTTIACGGAACPDTYVKGPLSVSLSATDGGGGTGVTRYTLDGTDPTTTSTQYTAPFSVTSTKTVKFRTWNTAGQAEAVRTQLLKVDAVAPTASVTQPSQGASILAGSVTVKVDAADSDSGIGDVQLFLDGDWFGSSSSTGSPYQFTLPASSLPVGAHRVKALAIDAAGNQTTSAETTFTIKDGLPVTSIACNGAACSTDWVKGPVSVSLSAADGGTGLGATRFTLDGTDPTTSSPAYIGPFTLTEAKTVKFRTWNSSGTPETVKTQSLKIDAAAPVVSITSPTDGANLQGDVTINVNATDAGSGISDAELYLDGDWKAYTATAPYKFTLPAGSLSLGTHRIKVIAYDNLGNNTITPQVNFSLKDGLPETTIACNGAACSTDWVKGPVSVSLSATNGGGGLGATRYTLDGSDPTTSSPVYTAPFTLTDTKTVKFRTWDSSGAPETVKSQALKIDAVAPAVSITSPANGANLQGDVTIDVSATDAGSGISDAELYLDGDWKAYTAKAPYKFTLPAGSLSLGTHRIKVIGSDNLGNSTATPQVNFSLKDGLPETAIACDGIACPTDWVKGPVSVSLSATNGGGGLGATRYTLDGSDPTPSSPQYTAPFTLTSSTTVKFRTWDLTGQPETVKTQALKIDAVAPAVSITSPANGANLQGDVTIDVNAIDAGSGISDAELYLDGDWKAYTAKAPYKFTLPASELALGAHRIKVIAYDNLGNSATTPQVNFSRKDGLPETAIACDGAVCPTDFVKGPVSISLTAANGGGGLGATRYTLDGTDPDTNSPAYTAPFTLTDTKTVKFRTWDSAGAAETVKSQTIKIDAIAPTVSITSPTDGANVQGDVTIDVNALDSGSGISDAELYLDGDWKAYTAKAPYKFTLPASSLSLGAHRIKVIAYDNLGNSTATPQVSFSLKDGLPETAIACNGAACSPDWQKGPVSVSLSATNSGGGGLGATRYTLDGTDPDTTSPQYAGPFTLTESKTVKFRTWDTTGAAESVKTQALKVDAVAPTAQVTSPTEGSNVVGDVHVKADASDAGAGLADVELFLDGDFAAVSSSHGSPYEFTVPAGTIPLGTHRLKIIATDALGNRSGSDTVTFALTNGVPTTTIACDGVTCSNDWQKGPVQVSLSAADNGSGLGATRYTLDGSDPDTSSTTYSGPFTLTDTKTVKFRTWDSTGNAEQVGSQTIKLDAVAPTAAIATPADGSDQVGGVDVTVDASDADSGIADVQLFVDGDYTATSTSTASPYSFTLAAGSLSFGTHKLKALATDKLGNSTGSAPVTITLKDGVPMTTIACDGGTCPSNFVKGPVSVTLAAIDGGSGVAATRYTLDGSDPDSSSQDYTGPFAVSATTTVKFRSWSSAGDVEPVHTQTIKLDATAPTAQLSSPAEGDQVEGDVTVKVDATDADSGIGDVALFIDGDYVGSSTSTSAPYEFTWHAGDFLPGAHRLKAIVADKLDNRASTATVNVTIKSPPPPPGPPSTTISCDGLGCPAGFVKDPVSVTLASIDGGAGIGPTRYTLDGSDPSETSTEYAGLFTVSETTTVKFRSWGLDGVAEEVRSQTIKIDSTPPTVQVLSPTEGQAIAGDLIVQADVADAGAGVSSVDLYVDGDYAGFSHSVFSPYEITLPAGTLAPGTHKLKVEGTDKLGNSIRTDPVTFTVSS